ncbi:MAG: response regulator [Nocardioidaceae bacterium]|nr:response regulator [Nocardioidaceae bacterium]
MPPHQPRVLVVDDSDVIRSLIVLNLELDGFAVVEARDGLECLEIAATVELDAITLDVRMPGLDGFATATRLRADPSTAHIPIVLVSAQAQGKDLSRGAEIGVDAYVTKPFDPDMLVATVRSLTEPRLDR